MIQSSSERSFEDMPPEEEEPLDSGLKQSLISELRTYLTPLSLSGRSNPHAHPANERFQYNNSVQDLFGRQYLLCPNVCANTALFQAADRFHAIQLKVGSRPLGKSQMIEPRLSGVGPFKLASRTWIRQPGRPSLPFAFIDGVLSQTEPLHR